MKPLKHHYWRKDWYKSLETVVSDSQSVIWYKYRDYCQAQENGLRKQAFEHLDRFLESICSQLLENRLAFVRWIMPIAHQSPNFEQLLPYPIIEKLIRITLSQAVEQDPHDPDLLFWTGHLLRDQDLLQKAVEVSSEHVDSRTMLINWILDCPDFATHHLPDYFIGDPANALEACDDAERLLHSSLPADRTQMFTGEILEYRKLIKGYISSQQKPANGEQSAAPNP